MLQGHGAVVSFCLNLYCNDLEQLRKPIFLGILFTTGRLNYDLLVGVDIGTCLLLLRSIITWF